MEYYDAEAVVVAHADTMVKVKMPPIKVFGIQLPERDVWVPRKNVEEIRLNTDEKTT